MQRLPLVLAAAWWGSLSTLGFMVVPMLFAHLPTPALAGGMAAKLFQAQTGISVVCGLLLLTCWGMASNRVDAPSRRFGLAAVLAPMLLAVLVEFVVAPQIVARDNLRLWHALGSGLYALQWLLVSHLFWRLAGRAGRLE